MPKRSLGLDIGHFQIKGVVVEPKKKVLQLVSFAHAPTPERSIVKSKINHEDRVAEALQQLVKSQGWSGIKTTLGIAHGEIVLKRITFPKMPEQELHAAMEYELPELVAFPFNNIDEVAYSWDVIREGETNQEVIFAACRRSLIMPYVEIARKAGLEVAVVEVLPTVFPRTVEASGECAFVDIGHVRTVVYVELRGQFRVARVLPLGGVHFTEGIMEAYGVPQQDAEQMKHERELDDILADAPRNPGALRASLQQLVGGILQTLDYLRAAERSSSIAEYLERVRICGGTAGWKGLSAMLQQELEVPVSVVNPFLRFDKAQETYGRSVIYTGAAGLAARGLESG